MNLIDWLALIPLALFTAAGIAVVLAIILMAYPIAMACDLFDNLTNHWEAM